MTNLTLSLWDIFQVITHLEKSGWNLYGVTRVNTNSIDSLFFQKVECEDVVEQPKETDDDNNMISVLSLNRTDKLRLIEFDKSATRIISMALSNFYEKGYSTSIGKYHGAIEFKLRGSPFNCHGPQSVDSHRLICAVLQALSFEGQYDILTTIKVSDKVTSKSSFIMKQSSKITKDKDIEEENVDNSMASYACISFSEKNKLRLINLPADTTERIIKMVSEIYIPGMTVII